MHILRNYEDLKNTLILHLKELVKRNKLKPNIAEGNIKNQSRNKQNKDQRNNGKVQQN